MDVYNVKNIVCCAFWVSIALNWTNAAVHHSKKEKLHIIGLLPFSGMHEDVGKYSKPFIENAISDVNSNPSILWGYKLTVTWVNSTVSVHTRSIKF